MRRPALRSLAGGVAGIIAGVVAGVVLTGVSAGGPAAAQPAPALVDGAHLPPALVLPGEPVRLRFAIVCAPRDDGRPCDGAGEVYARAGQEGPFRRFELEVGTDSREGRYFVDLPAQISSSPEGFSYYAVLRGGPEVSLTLPAGGAAAPHRSFQLRDAARVDLGAHVFGRTRLPDARVVDARWGTAVGEVGLTGTRALGFTGPSSFDVALDGTVTLLDQVNGRIQRWRRGRALALPAAVGGGLADLAVERDGTFHVLEPATRDESQPTLRTFHPDGSPKAARKLADRTWSHLAVGPAGPVVQQQPSEQWFPAGARARGTPGRTVAPGKQLIVARVGERELRIAELAGHTVVRSWRIAGDTPLGEVQLVEPLGSNLVAVVKAYTDENAEFVALVLDRRGLVRRLSIEASTWAETAPLARFRLAGSSLYRLASSPTGTFVDRFYLEVTS